MERKTIVEIGVSAGGSASIILNAIRDIYDAKLFSFDYNTTWYREPENKLKTGFLVEQIVPELANKWKLYTGGVPCNYFDEHLPKDGVDICFIDTMHINPGEHLNILEIIPFLKKNAIIIYHDTMLHMKFESTTTNCVSINSLNGKRILLDSEKQWGLPNISGIVLDDNVDNMLYTLFSNLSLPWSYKITNDDFIQMYKHFLKYYSKDLVRIYLYYCYFYMNDGLQNKDFAIKIAKEQSSYLSKDIIK